MKMQMSLFNVKAELSFNASVIFFKLHVFLLEHTALMVLCVTVYFSEDATLALQASFQISPL